MPKLNLFNYATKELSQDAITCWLIEWAGAQVENESEQKLRKVGHAFVDALLTKHVVVDRCSSWISRMLATACRRSPLMNHWICFGTWRMKRRSLPNWRGANYACRPTSR